MKQVSTGIHPLRLIDPFQLFHRTSRKEVPWHQEPRPFAWRWRVQTGPWWCKLLQCILCLLHVTWRHTMEDGPCVTPLMNTRSRVQKLHTVRRLLTETMATGLTATTFQYVPWSPETFNCVHSRRRDLDIREYKINDATAATTPQILHI